MVRCDRVSHGWVDCDALEPAGLAIGRDAVRYRSGRAWATAANGNPENVGDEFTLKLKICFRLIRCQMSQDSSVPRFVPSDRFGSPSGARKPNLVVPRRIHVFFSG